MGKKFLNGWDLVVYVFLSLVVGGTVGYFWGIHYGMKTLGG